MTVSKCVEAVSLAVFDLQVEVGVLADAEDPPDLEDVVRDLIQIRAIMERFRDARDALGELAASLMPQRQITLDGLGTIERHGGWNRSKWDHDRLVAQVIRWAREDRERYARENDGEVPPESEGEIVARLLRSYASIGSWKVTAPRKERGFDVDEYCHKEKARPGISLPAIKRDTTEGETDG